MFRSSRGAMSLNASLKTSRSKNDSLTWGPPGDS